MVFGVNNVYFLSKSDVERKKKMPNEGSDFIPADFLVWKSQLCALNMGSLLHFLTDITMAFPFVKALLSLLREEERQEPLRVLRVGLAVVDDEVEGLPLFLLSFPDVNKEI